MANHAFKRDAATASSFSNGILAKASQDHWKYLVQMEDGRRFACSEITEIGHGFVHLSPEDFHSPYYEGVEHEPQGLIVLDERGVDVNLRYVVSVHDGVS